MNNRINRIMIFCTVTALAIAMIGCGAKKETEVKSENVEKNLDSSEDKKEITYKTYEVETFDGTTVKIDDTNIISQEKVEDVLETTLVPSDAEVIAPGRDFVYLADANNYYVEDVVDQLLTIAKKSDTGDELNSKK